MSRNPTRRKRSRAPLRPALHPTDHMRRWQIGKWGCRKADLLDVVPEGVKFAVAATLVALLLLA